MKEQINKVFEGREEIPLFYIESGSRLWNIASPDSDYDVRGIHLQSIAQKYDFQKHRDVIEVMDGDFDFVSYDLDKFLNLLLDGNATILEWFRSDIIYFSDIKNFEAYQLKILDHVNFKSIFYHYISLAKKHYQLLESGKKFTYKVIFYCIRALLSADLAAQNRLAELDIEKLFSQFDEENEVIVLAKSCLDQKRAGNEKQYVEEEKREHILRVLNVYRERLLLNLPNENHNKEKLRELLRAFAFEVKSSFYHKAEIA
ncbi:nucleotidyltransferase domain-containing protein [Sediminitomix flava]|uniref:Nucleotidyltransferase n=1 Tax=Sediminitomix flava TaxID=379075 RepID=A0A315Z9E9_SEDFL|nr:nucleotidyltransferase domain-containing protein [Sediminitomix flava]PWJ42176.1 hypothetical protein BC781_103427 [Sediminitomix flava]